MKDFILHNSTTGEVYCANCTEVMFAYESARHECDEAVEAWVEYSDHLIKDWAKEYYGDNRD